MGHGPVSKCSQEGQANDSLAPSTTYLELINSLLLMASPVVKSTTILVTTLVVKMQLFFQKLLRRQVTSSIIDVVFPATVRFFPSRLVLADHQYRDHNIFLSWRTTNVMLDVHLSLLECH